LILDHHSLQVAEHLDLAQAAGDRLHLAHANQRGARLDVPAGWLSLWLPLHGELQLESPQSHWTLPCSQLLIARDTSLIGGSRAAGLWLALAGPYAIWSPLLQMLPDSPHVNELFPRQWVCPRDLRRLLVHLTRQARDHCAAHEPEPTLRELCAALLERQRDLQPLIDRCNGRTLQRRRFTLQRLLRVHQLIERDGEGRLDLNQLARSASYSPWHLIRMYREVFGETPSEHAARLRLGRAWSLVRDSALPVCEITEKLGFESQSAFCRAFKNAYGLTTTQVRHLPPAASHPTSLRPSHMRPRTRHARAPRSALR
jgi:AraC family transcriptional regulator